MTNPHGDISAPHAVVKVFDIEGGSDVQLVEILKFYGDCLTSPKTCAEEWLRKNDFVCINVAGTSWEERGIGSKQATLEDVSA